MKNQPCNRIKLREHPKVQTTTVIRKVKLDLGQMPISMVKTFEIYGQSAAKGVWLINSNAPSSETKWFWVRVIFILA